MQMNAIGAIWLLCMTMILLSNKQRQAYSLLTLFGFLVCSASCLTYLHALSWCASLAASLSFLQVVVMDNHKGNHLSNSKMSGDNKEEEKSGTITVRVIRSLQHKNWKPLVIRNCLLNKWTLKDLRDEIEAKLGAPGSGFPPPYTRDLGYYDSIKLETDPSANHAKSANALINTSTPPIPFQRDALRVHESLASLHIVDQCELSLYNFRDYEAYMSSSEHYTE